MRGDRRENEEERIKRKGIKERETDITTQVTSLYLPSTHHLPTPPHRITSSQGRCNGRHFHHTFTIYSPNAIKSSGFFEATVTITLQVVLSHPNVRLCYLIVFFSFIPCVFGVSLGYINFFYFIFVLCFSCLGRIICFYQEMFLIKESWFCCHIVYFSSFLSTGYISVLRVYFVFIPCITERCLEGKCVGQREMFLARDRPPRRHNNIHNNSPLRKLLF